MMKIIQTDGVAEREYQKLLKSLQMLPGQKGFMHYYHLEQTV